MKLSVILDPGRAWSDMTTLAQDVDAAGWHAIYTCDHFMPNTESGAPADGSVMECWTTLTALAAQTDQVRLGSLVMSNTYRHPAVVANMAATLDIISDGRVILGVGAGWQVNEHAAYGIALPEPRARIEALDEACAVMTGLLRERRTTLAGGYYSLDEAPCDPKPKQVRLPLLVATGGERFGLRVVARHADIWHHWMDAETLRRKSTVVDEYCAEIGRDPSTLVRSTGGTVDPDDDRAAIIDRLTGLAEAGADEFILIDDASTTSAEQARRLLDHLSRRVLPHLS